MILIAGFMTAFNKINLMDCIRKKVNIKRFSIIDFIFPIVFQRCPYFCRRTNSEKFIYIEYPAGYFDDHQNH